MIWLAAACSSPANDGGSGAGGSAGSGTGGGAGSGTGGSAGSGTGGATTGGSGGAGTGGDADSGTGSDADSGGGGSDSGTDAGTNGTGGTGADASSTGGTASGTGGDTSGTGGAGTGGDTTGTGGTGADAGSTGGTASGTGGNTSGTGGSTTGIDGGVAQGGGDAGTDGATCPANTDFLNDPQNCGHCGKSCAGGTCDQGLCTAVLVMDTQEPPYSTNLMDVHGFADPSKVYLWEKTTSLSNHYKLLSASSTPTNPVSTGDPALQDTPFPPDIGSVTFDATYVYEAALPTTLGDKAQVNIKTLADNSAPAKLFTLPAGPTNPNTSGPSDLIWDNIALGTNAIYLSGTTNINGFMNPVPDTTTIYSIATPVADPGNEATPLVSGLGEKVRDLSVFGNATAGEHLFWLDYTPSRPDTDAGFGTDYFVLTVPVAGGTPVLLDDANTSGSAFASDGTYVYWTQINDLGKLMRCPLANLDAAHVEAVADASNPQEGLIVQGQYAYFMEYSDPGPIYRVNTGTGLRELLGNRTVSASVKNSYLFGADATFLYMTNIDGTVYRLPIVP